MSLCVISWVSYKYVTYHILGDAVGNVHLWIKVNDTDGFEKLENLWWVEFNLYEICKQILKRLIFFLMKFVG